MNKPEKNTRANSKSKTEKQPTPDDKSEINDKLVNTNNLLPLKETNTKSKDTSLSKASNEKIEYKPGTNMPILNSEQTSKPKTKLKQNSLDTFVRPKNDFVLDLDKLDYKNLLGRKPKRFGSASDKLNKK